jgi:hypothetical protein
MKAKIVKTLKCPLATAWTEQYVRLPVQGLPVGDPVTLLVNGNRAPFQYTGQTASGGTEVLVRLGFEKGETKELVFAEQRSEVGETDLQPVELPIGAGCRIGMAGREVALSRPTLSERGPGPERAERVGFGETRPTEIPGPFAAFAGFPFTSRIHCEQPFERATLVRTNDGPLFTDYRLQYEFAEQWHYTLQFRCYQHEPIIEVAEKFSLGLNASLELTLNPQGRFDSILSRDNFETETAPIVEPLALERPGDVLCRLQMPVLSEYFVPNNRGWFALFDSRDEARGMLGLLGLSGARWVYPVQNMLRVSVAGGRAVLRASLAGGERHWLLYAGPVQRGFRVQGGERNRGRRSAVRGQHVSEPTRRRPKRGKQELPKTEH